MNKICEIDDISFADCEVFRFQIDHDRRIVAISVADAIGGSGTRLGRGELLITGWRTAHQKRYDMRTREWIDVATGYEEAIKDIAEIETVQDQHVVIRGFGASTGEWTELSINKGFGVYRLPCVT